MWRIETDTRPGLITRLATLCAIAGLLLSTSVAAKPEATDTDPGYVDSVYSWGIWELGLEPASGPEAPAENAMNDRSKQLKFRPNDNAAFIVRSIPVPQQTTDTPSSPLPVPTAIPPVPVIGPGGSGPILPGMVPNPPNLR